MHPHKPTSPRKVKRKIRTKNLSSFSHLLPSPFCSSFFAYFIVLIIFAENYKFWSSLLLHVLQSSLRSPQIYAFQNEELRGITGPIIIRHYRKCPWITERFIRYIITMVMVIVRIGNPLKPSGHYIHHQVQHSKIVRSTHTAAFICFMWISEQTAIISLYSINWLVCIIERECVYYAVRNGYLNVIPDNFTVCNLYDCRVSVLNKINLPVLPRTPCT
jgi:hypothetical protein